jgi:hypothetical protein
MGHVIIRCQYVLAHAIQLGFIRRNGGGEGGGTIARGRVGAGHFHYHALV